MYTINKALKSIVTSFIRTIHSGREGVNPYYTLPEAITGDPTYLQYLKKQSARNQNCGHWKVVVFLTTQQGMKFIDLGCCLKRIDSGYSLWKSKYYGIDSRCEVTGELQANEERTALAVGELYFCGMHEVLSPDNFFDIVSCISSLAYFRIGYVIWSLEEYFRILESNAQLVLDISNRFSKEYKISQCCESYLSRELLFDLTPEEFEQQSRDRLSIVRRNAFWMLHIFSFVANRGVSAYG